MSDFRLAEVHQNRARLICAKHVTKRYRKKGCTCANHRGFLTGVKGLTKSGVVVACRCVNLYAAGKEWAEYCSQFPELAKIWPMEERGWIPGEVEA